MCADIGMERERGEISAPQNARERNRMGGAEEEEKDLGAAGLVQVGHVEQHHRVLGFADQTKQELKGLLGGVAGSTKRGRGRAA